MEMEHVTTAYEVMQLENDVAGYDVIDMILTLW